jgi:large subunit ribosomal protein L17
MRHRIAGRKLGRTSEHRLALMRNMSTALLDKERITTTLAKAKELRRFAEKLVTLSKKETLHARRRVLRHIHDREVVAKLFDTLSARYAERPGGSTRVIKLGPRRGDNAEMALIELVGSEIGEPAPQKRRGKKPARPAKADKSEGAKADAATDDAATAKKTTKKTAKKKSRPKKEAGAAADTRSPKKASTSKAGSRKSTAKSTARKTSKD